MGFLTAAERRELTGAATKAGQVKVLKNNHIPFFLRADGWPVVTWEALNGVLHDMPAAANSEHFKLDLNLVK